MRSLIRFAAIAALALVATAAPAQSPPNQGGLAPNGGAAGGSSVGAATQLPLPGNIIARWSAGQGTGVTANNAPIAAWTDIIGGAQCTQATGANQPQLATNRVNGLPSVNFNGSFYCQLPNTGTIQTALTSNSYTIFIAARMLGGAYVNGTNCIVCASTSFGANIYVSEDGVQNGQAFALHPVPFPDQMGFHTIGLSAININAAVTAQFQTQYLLQGGSVYGSTASGAPSASTNALTFGAASNAAAKCTCEIFEVVIWNTGLVLSQWKQAQMWADDLYGQPYPWAQAPYVHVFFGDSIMLGAGATTVIGTPPYIIAQNLGLKMGQWDNVGVSGITLAGLITLAPTWVNPVPAQIKKPILNYSFEFYNSSGLAPATSYGQAKSLLAGFKSTAGIYTIWGTSTSTSGSDTNRIVYDADFDNVTLTGTYNNGTGAVVGTLSSPTNIQPGTVVNISGATGTGAFASINGPQTATTGSGGSVLDFTIASGLGATTITGGNVAGLIQPNIDSYCPLHNDYRIGVPGAEPLFTTIYSADGVHPNNVGNGLLAEDWVGCATKFIEYTRLQAQNNPGYIGYPTYVTQSMYGVDGLLNATVTAGASGQADTNVYMIPFQVRTPLTIKGLGLRITTGGSSTCILSLWDSISATNQNPGNLVASTSTTSPLSNSTPGIISGPIYLPSGSFDTTATTSLLTPGFYWAGVQCNDNSVIWQSVQTTLLAQNIGATTYAGVSSASGAVVSGYDYANTYASGPPISLTATAPTGTFTQSSQLGPNILFQVNHHTDPGAAANDNEFEQAIARAMNAA